MLEGLPGLCACSSACRWPGGEQSAGVHCQAGLSLVMPCLPCSVCCAL